MGKVLWHTMMSLDGFVAGANDDMRWVFGVDGGSGRTAQEVVRSTGALLVGRRTQDVEDQLQPGFYGGRISRPLLRAQARSASLFGRSGGEAVRLRQISSAEEGETTVLRYSVGTVADDTDSLMPE